MDRSVGYKYLQAVKLLMTAEFVIELCVVTSVMCCDWFHYHLLHK